jgi:hypothetical protein
MYIKDESVGTLAARDESVGMYVYIVRRTVTNLTQRDCCGFFR